LQRSLQKGRKGLDELYRLGPPHVGQGTCLADDVSVEEGICAMVGRFRHTA